MRRALIVVADEAIRFPQRSAGHRLARALGDSRSWRVEVLDAATQPGRKDVGAAVRRLAEPERPDRKPVVILFGDVSLQRQTAWEIVKAGLRPRVVLVLYLRVGEVPLPRAAAETIAFADLVVVESRFGARAVRSCLREAQAPGEPRIAIVPPAALDEMPRGDARRADEADDAPFRVGCVLEPYAERNAFLALWIFRLFADGHYSLCDDCAFVTPWSERVEDFAPTPAPPCMRCRSDRSRRGRPWPATLRIIAFPAPHLDAAPESTWDLPTLRSVLELSGRVFVEGEDGFPILDTEAAWLDCLASFDAHLCVDASAGVDRAAVATCALGIPTLITQFGASSEILEGRARQIEPRDMLLRSSGCWSPVMDVGRAAAALAELAGARDARGTRVERARITRAGLAPPGEEGP